ncbi:MAG: hypothetical protein AAGC65_25360 [Mucilaginibacter sp.]|uniref:hypothetical protein n=1 Tax=Mucilaginibacter sp. TaxID=1882438 RepID=UPI0031A79171
MQPITKENSKYFYKSKYWYKITWFTFLWIILYTQIAKAISINAVVNAILTLFPFLGILALVPLGTLNVLKSYLKKEPYNKYRTFYLLGYLFFWFLLLALIVAVVIDIKKFNI